MASETDEIRERLLEDFRPRLKEGIIMDQVLDYIHFLTIEQKEQITQKEKTEGNSAAVDLLITNVLKKPHEPGWFRTFIDALSHGGFKYAAKCIQEGEVDEVGEVDEMGKIPSPEEDAENGTCVQLIQILFPSLVDMKTEEVRVCCLSRELITNEDMENITAEITNKGPIGGARELLRRIIRGPPGWFSTFLEVLRETDHKRLLYELTGGPPQGDGKEGKLSSHKDEPTGNEAVVESHDSLLPDDGTLEEATDLYNEASTDSEQLANNVEPAQTGNELMAAGGGPQKGHIVLRDYQMEVARPALEGKNIIICLPTGSGKTRVAVYITQKHLDSRKREGLPGKVVVLVNKVPLVEQHYSEEFSPFLKPIYKVERVSGNSQLKISFTEIVKNNDVIICTAQILENYLERSVTGEDEGVHLSDLTLIVIDECHHTQKGGVYNHVMMRYLTQKHKNKRLEKEQKQIKPLPQILGLTASPGVGGATKMSKTEEHILRICANLDASTIMTGALGQYTKETEKTIVNVESRQKDPFGDVIKKIMNAIHAHAGLNPSHECGSQPYEQWAVQIEGEAAKEENQTARVCAFTLRRYNEGLQLSNTIRMCDAFSFLNKYYEDERRKKTSPDDDLVINITPTERFLFNLFKENKEELMELAKNPEYENDSLSKLKTTILHEFTGRKEARGIIFTKTRRSAIALTHWIQENPKFADIAVNAAYLIGGGDQSVVKPMTATEQKDVLKKFGSGEINLLVATTVAEEGLDIPACNFVIRYGLVTNEISMIQARGRGRAEDSTYTLVETKGSGVAEKETVNEYRINMMNKAIDKIRALDPKEYNKRILEFQMQAIMEEKLRAKKKKQKCIRNGCPSELKLNCRGCSKPVCTGEDIEIIENMHRVNLRPQFSELYIQKENDTLRERRLDYETNCSIACKECGNPWGSMMLYRGIDCPCLHVKNFAVTLNDRKISKCSRWSELPVKFQAFDYAEHAHQVGSNSDDDDD